MGSCDVSLVGEILMGSLGGCHLQAPLPCAPQVLCIPSSHPSRMLLSPSLLFSGSHRTS